MRYVKETFRGIGVMLGISILAFSPIIYAETASSPNYSVDQTFFGTGGELNSCSGSYCSKQTAGELTVGNTSSSNYAAWAGFNTTDEPFIEFVVTADNIDLGVLSTSATATTTGTFRVRAWQADGYVVITASDPPKNNTYSIATPATPTASVTGTEQFGINLVANSSPTSFGSDPVQLPDATFSFGQAATDYGTANLYKYTKGDIVAFSDQSTSITEYTVSYIYNISTLTAGGTFTFNHVLVATGTY